MLSLKFSNQLLNLFLISIFFFLIKWGLSFLYLSEDLITKIMFENPSDGSFYLALSTFLANLDFQNYLNSQILNTNFLPLPFSSILLHSIFFKIFGLYGFIIVDFFGIFLFFFILNKVFSLFLDDKYSILIVFLLYSIPILLLLLPRYIQTSLPFIHLNDFYNLRAHRPFPSNLFFFYFIYIILKFYIQTEPKKKYYLIIGAIFGLSLMSSYQLFITELVLFLLILLYKFKKRILKIFFNNYSRFLLTFISFLITILPFLFNLSRVDPDLLSSIGVRDVTFDNKIVILSYIFFKLINIKFLSINFFLIFTLFFIKKFNFKDFHICLIFYFIYLSTLLAPFVFIFFSPKISFLYHFANNIIIYAFLSLLINIILIIKVIPIRINYRFLIILFPIVYFLNISQNINKYKNGNLIREELNKVAKKIEFYSSKEKIDTVLNFHPTFMIWSILSDKVKYLNLTMLSLTPKNTNQNENDLINVFRFLNLDSDDFINFLKNKKQSWRYYNQNTATFFLYKYSANSLFTYNDSKNFSNDVKKFIKQTSPLINQQIVIPDEEFNRLEKKFNELQDNIVLDPDLILLKTNLSFLDKINLDKKSYCQIYEGKIYILYIKKRNKTC